MPSEALRSARPVWQHTALDAVVALVVTRGVALGGLPYPRALSSLLPSPASAQSPARVAAQRYQPPS
jgi:hypothetical protein